MAKVADQDLLERAYAVVWNAAEDAWDTLDYEQPIGRKIIDSLVQVKEDLAEALGVDPSALPVRQEEMYG